MWVIPAPPVTRTRNEVLAAFPRAAARFEPSVADLVAIADKFDGAHKRAAAALASAMLARTIGRLGAVVRKSRCVCV